MKSSPLSRPLPNATLPRNTFSRGMHTRVNFPLGMAIPVFSEFVPLGTKFELSRGVFMRMNDLNTAAFPDIDFNIDFFVVPINLLMSRYEEFKTSTLDCHSSAFDNPGFLPPRLPYTAISDVYSAINSNVQYTDILGADIKYGAYRLFDLLNYDDASIKSQQVDRLEPNILRLLAYQKCYYDHYRNTAYEANKVTAYNADWAYNNGGNGYVNDPDILRSICEIHYVNYRKDYFQSVYPGLNYVLSQQVSWSLPNSVVGSISPNSYSISGVTGVDGDRWKTSAGLAPALNAPVITTSSGSLAQTPQGAGTSFIVHDHTVSGSVSINNGPSDYNVQAIRAAFAMDKLLRASAYAPKHVKDQLEARYGVKLRQSFGHESVRIGSFANRIVIGEVTSTANTVSGNTGDGLGAIGGKGIGAEMSSRPIRYTVESDSIVMGIAYATVRSVYDSHRVDNFNLKSVKEDLPIPEFMDLGLQPLYRIELDRSGSSFQDMSPIGYITRDQEYKVGIDSNHGLFRLNEPLSVFTNHTNLKLQQGSSAASALYFKVAPSDLNSIMTVAYDPSDQTTDQFFGDIWFKFECRQNMTVHGQPRL